GSASIRGARVVHFGVGNKPNCGGGKAAAQEEGRAFAAFRAVSDPLAAVLLAQLCGGRRVPVDLRVIQQCTDRVFRQAVRTQFRAHARRAITLRDARTQDHLAETAVVLIVLLTETCDRLTRFRLIVAAALQPRAQLALRMLAAREHGQAAVVGAALVALFLFVLGETTHGPPELRLYFLGTLGRHHATSVAHGSQQLGAQRFVQFLGDARVVLQVLARIFLALPDALAAVAVPSAGFLDQIVVDAQFDQLAFVGCALAVEDFELGLPERRSDCVLHYLDAGFRTDHLLALLNRTDTADVQPHGSIELQRVAAGGGFRVAEHHADLHSNPVDEDHQSI